METHQNKSWFSRNWGWVLGGGCLTLIIVAAIGIGALFFGVTKAFKSSEPYQYAMEKTLHNNTVVEALGEPIEGGMINGNISFENSTGEANFSIPISGPDGSGRIFISAKKFSDEWTYDELYVELDGLERKVNLLDDNLEIIDK